MNKKVNKWTSFGALAALWPLLLSVGCISPGKEVRTASEQKAEYLYDAEKMHSVVEGPQTVVIHMMEGEFKMNEDGTVNWAESLITHYLKVTPSAEHAVTGLESGYAARARETEAWTGLLGKVADKIPVATPP
ncbi:MAG: hypothetical protein ACYTAN_09790 [Planctomycetota bacterium]|jgi:coenzyme F420-reducing hydrogenase alpha subunit